MQSRTNPKGQRGAQARHSDLNCTPPSISQPSPPIRKPSIWRVFSHSGGGIRTRDLRVMSPTSYQTAPPRVAPTVVAKNGSPSGLNAHFRPTVDFTPPAILRGPIGLPSGKKPPKGHRDRLLRLRVR